MIFNLSSLLIVKINQNYPFFVLSKKGFESNKLPCGKPRKGGYKC